jgi:hypothetical protein
VVYTSILNKKIKKKNSTKNKILIFAIYNKKYNKKSNTRKIDVPK